MKSAIVMFADSPSYYQLAGELNFFLQNNAVDLTETELWLFYSQEKPAAIADMNIAASRIQLIKSGSRYVPEVSLGQLEQLQRQKNVELLLFNGDAFGNELATRLAFRLKGSSSLNVEKMTDGDRKLFVDKAVYGNNLTATFELLKPPYCLSVARTAAKPASAVVVNHDQPEFFTVNDVKPDWIENVVITERSNEAQPHEADRLLVIGRGVNPAFIANLQETAKALDAYLAGSRPVVMNGWLEANRMIGVSGLKLAPDLCIIAGASGAAAFSAGICDSEFIIAVNNDKNARIFTLADVAIVDDLEPVFLELNALMTSE